MPALQTTVVDVTAALKAAQIAKREADKAAAAATKNAAKASKKLDTVINKVTNTKATKK